MPGACRPVTLRRTGTVQLQENPILKCFAVRIGEGLFWLLLMKAARASNIGLPNMAALAVVIVILQLVGVDENYETVISRLAANLNPPEIWVDEVTSRSPNFLRGVTSRRSD